MKYTLKHKFWSGKLELWKDDTIIGHIKNYSVWKGHAVGYLYDKKYFFMNKGAFAYSTEILDEMDHVIGEINFSAWSSKAEIVVGNNRYMWENNNFWSTRWKITDELGHEILLEKNEFNVNYSTYENNEFLFLLCTYLLYNFHVKMVAAT